MLTTGGATKVKEDWGGAGELDAGSDEGGRGGLIVNEGMDCAQVTLGGGGGGVLRHSHSLFFFSSSSSLKPLLCSAATSYY